MAYSKAEIEDALVRWGEAINHGGRTGDWTRWIDCYTADVVVDEHHYGIFEGREAAVTWLTETMDQWPFNHMQTWAWDWYTIDLENGWVIGQVQNIFVDPGDGKVYQAPNWTRLVYAGDGLFSREEDVYNPARFVPAVSGWLAAYAEHHPDAPKDAGRPVLASGEATGSDGNA
ncbi:nuclear transport factor 2 family protein [Mycobacterium sp. PDNC021]|uniref:nuclear transport factor 2 family protein n=1 Tax=Mycobacterium sp. PDNC021 TaxID=3391399 RepID=UPI003AAC895C